MIPNYPSGTSINSLIHYRQVARDGELDLASKYCQFIYLETDALTNWNFINHPCIFADKFQLYDFGLKGNLEKYGTRDPPLYNWTNVKIPSVIFYSEDDWFATIEVIQWLLQDCFYLLSRLQLTKVDYFYKIRNLLY